MKKGGNFRGVCPLIGRLRLLSYSRISPVRDLTGHCVGSFFAQGLIRTVVCMKKRSYPYGKKGGSQCRRKLYESGGKQQWQPAARK